MSALDELTNFVGLVNETFDEYTQERYVVMEALNKQVAPDNAVIAPLASALTELVEHVSDSPDEDEPAPAPPTPAEAASAAAASSASTVEAWAGSPRSSRQQPRDPREVAHYAAAAEDLTEEPFPEEQDEPVPEPKEEPAASAEAAAAAQEPPQKKVKHDAIPTHFTLGIALETSGIPACVLEIIGAMRDNPASLDWNSKLVRAVEKAIIFKLGLKMKFKQRGPPGPQDGGPSRWGGQAWRKNSGRWGNRGGKNKQYWWWYHSK